MTELQEMQALAEILYRSDRSIKKDAKILVGITKTVGGTLFINVYSKKERAIEHAKQFVVKYNKSCFIFDFYKYPTVVYTMVSITDVDSN